jgi:hypothetical protein
MYNFKQIKQMKELCLKIANILIQIEPAIPQTAEGYTYLSYEPDKPDTYLKRTREWIEKFANTNQLKKVV